MDNENFISGEMSIINFVGRSEYTLSIRESAANLRFLPEVDLYPEVIENRERLSALIMGEKFKEDSDEEFEIE